MEGADVYAQLHRVAPLLEDDTVEPWHLEAGHAMNYARRTPPARRQPHPCHPLKPLSHTEGGADAQRSQGGVEDEDMG